MPPSIRKRLYENADDRNAERPDRGARIGRAGAGGGAHPRQFLVLARLLETARRAARPALPAGRARLARPRGVGRREGPGPLCDQGPGANAAPAIETLGLAGARFVGWSLGGHFALELAPDLPQARGFLIFGTPPLAFPPAMELGFLPNPAMGVGFTETISREQAEAYVASFFAPGFADIPAFFLEDILRTDGRARSGVHASIKPDGYRDEAIVVRDLEAPLAVVHGAEDQLVNGGYFATLTMPTLWRGAVQTIPGAGHAPQWETPQAFDALLEAFIEETA